MIILLVFYHVEETSIVREVMGFFGIDLVSATFGSPGYSYRHCGQNVLAQRMVCGDRISALCRSDVQTL